MAKEIKYLGRNVEPIIQPQERRKTFREYALGFSISMAIDEAKRCLFCRDAEKRCIEACPVNVDVPGFIKKIIEGNLIGAYKKIIQSDPFPSVCGRVCPQERQCEGACILYYDVVRSRKNKGLPVSIGALEKFVGDFIRVSGLEMEVNVAEPTGKRVAIVGAGPAGLSCAYDLAKLGHRVHVYEALPKAGGVMMYGIPAARLEKSIVDWEVERLKRMGVEFFHGYTIGETLSLRSLLESYNAVFLAVGAGIGSLGIKGDHLLGVYPALDFLRSVNLKEEHVKLGSKTVIIGGGFTAVDCAITSVRLGVETHIVYRRTRETSSARDEEWDHIEQEGVIIHWLTQPIEILGDKEGKVGGVRCIKMKLGEPDESGRPKPIAIPGSEYIIECDSVIFAIGQRPDPTAYKELKDLKVSKQGTIQVDEGFRTSIKGLFAGGDVTNGGETVVRAIAHGRKAAQSIHEYLTKEVF
ncbi:MAG: NADPH-dependent glutamate synthase [Aquificaceae bacterium]